MKKILATLTLVMTCAIYTSTGFAADVAKIGVVNFEQVLAQSKQGKKNQEELKAKWNELQKKLDDEKKAVEEFSLSIERESLVLSPEKKREKQRDLRDRVTDLKKLGQDYTEEFQILQNQRMNQMQKDVFDIANALGKKEGFLLIIERKMGGVIYAPSQVDITDKVIKAYDAK